jgi:hypothetical protein
MFSVMVSNERLAGVAIYIYGSQGPDHVRIVLQAPELKAISLPELCNHREPFLFATTASSNHSLRRPPR